jgi:pyridoxamine 5'-phosphate oxidase
MDTPPARIVVDVPVIDHRTDPVQSDAPPPDPLALAADWLPAPGEDRALMTLSTIDADGFPRSRTVMLSEFDGGRFFFHTDARSRKVADLAANPRVSLTVLWPGFTRQLVVQGTAEIAPAAEVAGAYAHRSPYLRQLAWLNTADYAQLPRAERERRWAEFAAAEPQPPQPDGWVGYAVTPHRMLFWVSHPDAAGRRLEYVRAGNGWDRRYLPG